MCKWNEKCYKNGIDENLPKRQLHQKGKKSRKVKKKGKFNFNLAVLFLSFIFVFCFFLSEIIKFYNNNILHNFYFFFFCCFRRRTGSQLVNKRWIRTLCFQSSRFVLFLPFLHLFILSLRLVYFTVLPLLNLVQ